MTQTETAAARFARDGYAVFEGVLTDHLPMLRAACAGFVAREDARMDAAGVDSIGISVRGKRYFANECQREEPALRTMLFGETMAEICRHSLGDDAYFFLDQFVEKAPDGGLPFSWHQDSGYVRSADGPIAHKPYLTCWCPLDDATVENGTVHVIPGSHAEGLRAHDWDARNQDLAVAVEEAGVPLVASAGSVVAFSSLLLHATGANRSTSARRVYLAQYTPQPLVDAATGHLRRNAIRLLQDGRHVTRA
jgi:ectoine hydroxylase-related dioxygenase (phytanoyl-CoA dioxygenase family)